MYGLPFLIPTVESPALQDFLSHSVSHIKVRSYRYRHSKTRCKVQSFAAWSYMVYTVFHIWFCCDIATSLKFSREQFYPTELCLQKVFTGLQTDTLASIVIYVHVANWVFTFQAFDW